jgi:hypothetical protein
MTNPEPTAEVYIPGGPHIKATGQRGVGEAILTLTLVNRIASGGAVTLAEIKKVPPKLRHHLVDAVCLHKIKGSK